MFVYYVSQDEMDILEKMLKKATKDAENALWLVESYNNWKC